MEKIMQKKKSIIGAGSLGESAEKKTEGKFNCIKYWKEYGGDRGKENKKEKFEIAKVRCHN
jgi:lactate dehydrogenase-like 2-hydroxyacid dehydrogenase